MKDAEKLIFQVLKTPWAKAQFTLHVIRSHWADLVGPGAAPHSQPYRLENGILYVHTDHPAWSAHLMMMQGKLLLQLNRMLAGREGKKRAPRILKGLKCYYGVLTEEPKPKTESGPFIPKVDEKRRCPVCGVPLIGDETMCSACRREKLQETRQKIRRELLEAPWLTYEDCREKAECDRITFADVKAVLEEWAWNEALKPGASREAKAFAVMLDRGWTPDRLDEEQVERLLEKKRKGRFYVPARRK